MIEDDMVTDTLVMEALQHIADHGKVTVQRGVEILMVDLEITPEQAVEIINRLIGDRRLVYTPATLEVRE